MRCSSYGRVFKRVILFSNLFLKTLPIKGRLVGRPCLVCSLLKIYLKHMREMGGRKYELYTWSYFVFNWYHCIFSIGITIDILFVYSYMFLYMYAYTSNSINFDRYSIFHTYICVLFVITISLYIWAQILVMLSLIS